MKGYKRMKAQVESYLREEPRFRERKYKDRGIVNILRDMHPAIREIDKDLMIKVVEEFATMDRAWRKALAENKDLRGSDYEEKLPKMAKARQDLGYPS